MSHPVGTDISTLWDVKQILRRPCLRDPTLKVRSQPSTRGRFSRVTMDKKGQPQPCGRKRTWASFQNIWNDDNDGGPLALLM